MKPAFKAIVAGLTLASSAALLTGCQSTGGSKEDEKNAVTIAAAIGGMIAANAAGVDDNLGKVAIGAISGITARAIYDEVNKDTAADPDTDVEAVEINGQEFIQVNVKNVNFRSGSADLDPYELTRLSPVVKTLSKHPNTHVFVEGHTDSDGTKTFNQQLSENRAKNVAFHLMDNGITRDRISTYGYGEERPIASNDTAEGKRENRRVTFLIQEK